LTETNDQKNRITLKLATASFYRRIIVLCCSIIAALGLAESSSVVLVASMLVSPLMVCHTFACLLTVALS